MKILITGVGGFMASHIADRLIQKNFEVYGIDDFSGGFKRNINEKVKFTKLDLNNEEATEEYICSVKPEIIHHLACWPYEGLSQFVPLGVSKSVYFTSLNVFKSAVKADVKRIVYYSSMARYGWGKKKPPFCENYFRDPVDIYGASKCAAEVALEALNKACGLKYVILVPHNISGHRMRLDDPYRGVLGIWVNCLLRNKPFFIYGKGDQKRAFSHIDDIVDPCIQAGFSQKTLREIINIGSGKVYSLNECADILLKEFKSNLKPIYMPDRPCEVKDAFCSVEKSKKLLGFNDRKDIKDIFHDVIEYGKILGAQKPRYLKNLEITKGAPKTWIEKLI